MIVAAPGMVVQLSEWTNLARTQEQNLMDGPFELLQEIQLSNLANGLIQNPPGVVCLIAALDLLPRLHRFNLVHHDWISVADCFKEDARHTGDC